MKMNDDQFEKKIETSIEGRSRRHRNNSVLTGLFILAIGVVLLLRQSGFDFPFWLFTWPVILIGVGILGGIKNNFRPGGWMIVMAIGGIFLADRLIPGVSIQHFAWPLLLMAAGLWIIVRPKTHHRHFGRWHERNRDRRWSDDTNVFNDSKELRDDNEYLDTTSVFGGVKKIILSKNFKGGDITNFMGGTEINLTQADIPGKITIDTTNIFGGTKLIIPPTWDVQSDVVTIFGGVDDKRSILSDAPQPSKIIRLSGLCIFGGIEIRSF
jgi:predicted membrane protein